MAATARRHPAKKLRSPVPTSPGVKLWAGKIFSAWQKTVESYIEVGQLLIEARQNLAHGEYEAMIKSDLPFSAATARKLVAIADHQVLSNRSHGNVLPSNWTTLYQLALLPPDRCKQCIENGAINPKMQRKDAAALIKKPPRPASDKANGGGVLARSGKKIRDVPNGLQPERIAEVMAPDEKSTLLREFARFVLEVATTVSVDPKDHAQWKLLRERVKAIL
jgi:hypothetical protein